MSARHVTGVRPLLVAEKFGDTFQGEGPSTGVPACFIRLSRCNLRCAGCDTPETWNWKRFDPRRESRPERVEDVLAWALDQTEDLVVITGGEPLLQMPAVTHLVRGLRQAGRTVEIETNGTIAPSAELTAAGPAYNVSPKLTGFGAAMAEDTRIVPAALRALEATGRARFKFVVTTRDEFDEIAALAAAYALREIWVMPEGTTPEKVLTGLAALEEPARRHGFRICTRLHIILWGNVRGR